MHRKRLARMLPSVVAAAPGETEYRRGNPRPFDVLLSALGRELPSRSCSLSSQNSEHSCTFQSVRNCPYAGNWGQNLQQSKGDNHTLQEPLAPSTCSSTDRALEWGGPGQVQSS